MEPQKITEQILRENSLELKKIKPGLSANWPFNKWPVVPMIPLNQTAQTRRHLALFLSHRLPSGLSFEGRVEVKITQGVLKSDKILTTE